MSVPLTTSLRIFSEVILRMMRFHRIDRIYFLVFSSFWRMRMPVILNSLRAMRLSLWRLVEVISCKVSKKKTIHRGLCGLD